MYAQVSFSTCQRCLTWSERAICLFHQHHTHVARSTSHTRERGVCLKSFQTVDQLIQSRLYSTAPGHVVWLQILTIISCRFSADFPCSRKTSTPILSTLMAYFNSQYYPCSWQTSRTCRSQAVTAKQRFCTIIGFTRASSQSNANCAAVMLLTPIILVLADL